MDVIGIVNEAVEDSICMSGIGKSRKLLTDRSLGSRRVEIWRRLGPHPQPLS